MSSSSCSDSFRPLSVCSTKFLSSSSSACIRLLRLSTIAMFSFRSSAERRESSNCSCESWNPSAAGVTYLNHWCIPLTFNNTSGFLPTFRWAWTDLSCFWASAACLLAWLSWISISLRSPSIFFLTLRASFLLRVSASRELWRVSMVLCIFFLHCSISSSFSDSLRSMSAFTWLNSSWILRILPSSCSKEP